MNETAEEYEQELRYWPYRESLKKVEDIVCAIAPENGRVLDLMCGTGHLLKKIRERRPDLSLKGIDRDIVFLEYAWNKKFKNEEIIHEDVTKLEPLALYDAVLCTGALHHLDDNNQGIFIAKMSEMVRLNGFGVLSDCYIDDFGSEMERRLATARLEYEYLAATIGNNAPPEVIKSVLGTMQENVMFNEHKTSLAKRMPILEKHFHVTTYKTWPTGNTAYGDHIHLLRKR